MCRGFVLITADLGSTLGPGPFAACHSPSHVVSCQKSSAILSIKPKGQKYLEFVFCFFKCQSCMQPGKKCSKVKYNCLSQNATIRFQDLKQNNHSQRWNTGMCSTEMFSCLKWKQERNSVIHDLI